MKRKAYERSRRIKQSNIPKKLKRRVSMPTPFMCHECDSPTMNKSGICDKCMEELNEPTTADEYNKLQIDIGDIKGEQGIKAEAILNAFKNYQSESKIFRLLQKIGLRK